MAPISLSQNTAYSLFVEPYKIGFGNIYDGLRGRTTRIVCKDGSIRFQRTLSLAQSVITMLTGVLLIIPIINTIALVILQKIGTRYLCRQDLTIWRPVVFVPTPPSKAEILGRTMTVNRDKLHEAPIPFNVAQIELDIAAANPPVALDELAVQFDQIFTDLDENTIILNKEGSDVSVRAAKYRIQSHLIDFVANNQNPLLYDGLVGKSLSATLRAIVLEFRKPEIALDTKKEMMIRLASCAFHCPPRRHDETLAVYRILTNQVETVEQILLQYIQIAKEDLFLAAYPLSRETAATLNYIRREVDDLGLDRNEINIKDKYIGMHDARFIDESGNEQTHTTKAEFKARFNEFFIASNVIPIVYTLLKDRMNRNRDVQTNFAGFIHNGLEEYKNQGHLTEADLDLYPEPYMTHSGDDYELNEEGVKFLLVHSGLFNEQTVDGHLGKAPVPPVMQAVPLAAAAVAV